MTVERFVDKMKSIQNALLEFLEDESNAEDKYEEFINLIENHKIIKERYKFKALLQLINSIGSNHKRTSNFICNLERLLRHFQKDIKKYFSNSEIFELCKGNKRILLLLIEEDIIIIDEYVFLQITSNEFFNKNYCEYFQPEIKPFLTKENIDKYGKMNEILKDYEFIEKMNEKVEEDFYQKRREGENDDYLCELIRNDKIKDFVTFVEQTNLPLESCIKKSIFETNQFFAYKFEIQLIDYATFFGSTDIIKYMLMKGVELHSRLWICAIHSNNAEMIRILEDNRVSLRFILDKNILRESIQCHHNDVSHYIIDNLMEEDELLFNIEHRYDDNLYHYAAESYNYCFFPENMEYKNMFFYLSEFDYYTLVKLYLKEGIIDINAAI